MIFVILLDGWGDWIWGIEVGCDDFIMKFFDCVILMVCICFFVCMCRLIEMLDDVEKVLESLVCSVEVKDGMIGDYCDCLIWDGKVFGKFLGILRGDVRVFFWVGVFYDIGKIGIFDVVFLKFGKFNVEEWEVMK